MTPKFGPRRAVWIDTTDDTATPLSSAELQAFETFDTRPNEKVLDRENLGLAPASDAAQGVYLLRKARGTSDGSVVIQESAVAYAFVTETLPLLEKEGIDLDVWYVASAELFDTLTDEEKGGSSPSRPRWTRSASPASLCRRCIAGSAKYEV